MKKNIWLYVSIICTLFIWIQSLLPGSVSSQQSGLIVTFGLKILNILHININENVFHTVIRKLAHFTEFFILAFLWMKTLNKKYMKVFIIVLMVAMIDETLQFIHVDRSSAITDVLIDVLGSLFMLFMYKIYDLLYNRNVFVKK